MNTRRHFQLLLLTIAILLILSGQTRASQFAITSDGGTKLSFGPVFDGTNYLVAVQGDGLFNRANTKRQIAAQLISQTGVLVGPLIDTGRNASPSSNSTPIPHAAFDGSNYLLVWTDSANYPNDDIYGQRISPAGALIGSPFPISQAPKDQSVHGMVFDGTNYLVVWEDHRRGAVADDGFAPYDTYGQRVSKSGTLVGAEIRISPADDSRSYENSQCATHENLQFAAGVTNHFVVWVEGPLNGLLNTTVVGQFVSPSGTLVGSPVTIKANDGVEISTPNLSGIGFDGTNYLVGWHQDVSSTEQNLKAQRVSRAGALVGGVVTISTAPAKASFPRFVFDGVNYLATWSDSFNSPTQTCKARFIDPSGNPVSSEFAPFSSQGGSAPLIGIPIFDGRRFLVGGLLGNFNNGDLYGVFISPLPYGTFPIAITSSNEVGLSVGSDGTNYLAGIQGGPVDHDEITAQRFSPTGALIGPRITTGRFGGIPQVAFDGANYLMVWEDVANPQDRNIYGQFISPAGVLVRVPFAISAAGQNQLLDSVNHIAFDGSNYLVVWRDDRRGANAGIGDSYSDVYGQLVTPAGTLQGSEIPMATSADVQRGASVAFDGSNYLIAWQSRRAGVTELYDTYARLVSKTGVPGTTLLVSQSPSPSYNPVAIAFDGTNYLVVWNRDIGPGFPSPTDWDIYARLVSTSGTVAGNEFPITTAAGSQINFGNVLFDGRAFLVSWYDESSGSARSRYFGRTGAPLTGEFGLFGSQGTRAQFGGFFQSGSRLLALGTFAEAGFRNGDMYGLFVPPLRLDVAGPFANGQFQMQLSGAPGVNYAVQATTDLSPANPTWTTLTSTNTLRGTFKFIDTGAGFFNRRIYRAIQP